MYWNRSAADVATAWQMEIESKLEMGATALLLGGAPDTLLPSALTLMGLEQSILQRHDIATPMLVAGGNSALWLGLLLPPQPTGDALNTPAPTVVYGGPDEATYLALVGLTTAVATQSLAAPRTLKGNTPLEMGVYFAPRLQPGAATPWEMLPFIEVGEEPTREATNDATGDWIVWGIMLLALSLVLSAFLT